MNRLRIIGIWIWGLMRAAWNFPYFIAAWMKAIPAPIEVSKKRLETCHACEHLNVVTRQCDVCACFVWLKIQWVDEKCPKGKW
jgi:hypothetical protein